VHLQGPRLGVLLPGLVFATEDVQGLQSVGRDAERSRDPLGLEVQGAGLQLDPLAADPGAVLIDGLDDPGGLLPRPGGVETGEPVLGDPGLALLALEDEFAGLRVESVEASPGGRAVDQVDLPVVLARGLRDVADPSADAEPLQPEVPPVAGQPDA